MYTDFAMYSTLFEIRYAHVYEYELALFRKSPRFLYGLFLTIVWQVFVPVSLTFGLLLPLLLSWVKWDVWHHSPVFWGLLFTVPMKFVPWVKIWLVWPGLL